MTRHGGHEGQGWCEACRILWCWYGFPTRLNADCDKCGAALEKKPRFKRTDRYNIVNGRPRTRIKPPVKSEPPPSGERKSA